MMLKASIPGKNVLEASFANAPGDWNSLDYRRPDGTWITPPEPVRTSYL